MSLTFLRWLVGLDRKPRIFKQSPTRRAPHGRGLRASVKALRGASIRVREFAPFDFPPAPRLSLWVGYYLGSHLSLDSSGQRAETNEPMNDLREVQKYPDFLERKGFTCRKEESSDCVRSVWFEKSFDSIQSNVRFTVQVEYELFISDNPFCRTSDNFHYSFNGTYLIVIDRQMRRWDNQSYDEETECPREIDRYRLNIETMSRLRSLCEALRGSWPSRML